MMRNGNGHHQNASLPSRSTTLTNGKFVRGGKRKGMSGKGRGGRVKRY